MRNIRKEASNRARFNMEMWGQWSGRRELVRGFFHFSVGFAAWVLLQWCRVSMSTIGNLLLGIGAGVFSFDLIRVWINQNELVFDHGWLGKISRWVSRHLTRESEQRNPANVLLSFWGLGVAWFCCLLVDAPWIAAAQSG